MNLTVRFFGPIKRPWKQMSRTIQVHDIQDIGGLLERLGYSTEDRRWIKIFVEGVRCGESRALRDGDVVDVTLLAGGG